MKILVADDSPVLRTAVTRLLEPAGYEVVLASDGIEAITRFYEERPDLVLLDVQMPKLIGYVVCRLIKDDPAVASTPVLILTARDTEEDRYWGERSGADGYLTKDALGDGLIAHIRTILATRALHSLSGEDRPDLPTLGETDVLTRVCEMLDRKLFEATVVNELTGIGTRSMELRTSVSEVLKSVRRLIAFDIGAVVMVDDLAAYIQAHEKRSPEEYEDLQMRTARKLRSVIGQEIEPVDLNMMFLNGKLPDPNIAPDQLGSYYAAPLEVRGDVVGILVLAARRPGVFTEAVLRTMSTIVPPIAAVVESAKRYQEALIKEARSSLSSLSGD